MYDTINSFTLTNDRVNQDCLNNLNEFINEKTGQRILKGDLGNLKIKQVYDGVSIFGSLPKYFLGNNLETLTRQGTERAIEKISDELCIKCNGSKIYRIDIAGNLLMKEPTYKYLSYLGDCRYMKKSNFNNSLYYSNSKKQIIFYDKPKEMKKKRADIPEEFKKYEDRILRFELRFKKRIKDQFGKIIFLSDLSDEDFYIMILNKWKEAYFEINKIKSLNLNKMEKVTSKEFKDYLLSYFILEKGLDQILNSVDTNRDKFKSSTEASRLKAEIKRIINNSNYSDNSELTLELDEKVIQAVKYYR